ncbi:MAG: hypothetical protein ACYS8W_16445 [Planctomycetota bacterium]
MALAGMPVGGIASYFYIRRRLKTRFWKHALIVGLLTILFLIIWEGLFIAIIYSISDRSDNLCYALLFITQVAALEAATLSYYMVAQGMEEIRANTRQGTRFRWSAITMAITCAPSFVLSVLFACNLF